MELEVHKNYRSSTYHASTYCTGTGRSSIYPAYDSANKAIMIYDGRSSSSFIYYLCHESTLGELKVRSMLLLVIDTPRCMY